MNVPVIIPTYNPTKRILDVISGLHDNGFDRIIVIDDGSRADCAEIFSLIENLPFCTLLRHEVNCGKGRGLKTGFSYVAENIPDCAGVVTTDDDGQHSPKDILRCAQQMEKSHKAVLGARDFSGENVPPKSRFGNNITKFVFRVICGIKITDTQTGLRAIPLNYLPYLISLSGERFEYETNMLLEMKRLSLDFEELTIETIYSDNNKGTHFNPLKDSIKIYCVILKFMLSSLICSLIDIGLFTALNLLLIPLFGSENARLLTATAAARVVSSATNYLVNKKRVFRSDSSVKHSAPRYYILCAAQMVVSFLCVRGLSALFGTEQSVLQSVLKIIVDTVLFFVSFGIQRDWVYADKPDRD